MATILEQSTVTDARSFKNDIFTGLPEAATGGAIFCTETGDVTIENSTFSSDRATDAGGAVYCVGMATVSFTKFRQNTAAYGGAFCYAGGYTSDFLEVTMTQNVASFGGAFYNTGLTYLEGVTFTSNFATMSGGGVYNMGLGTCSESAFNSNTASYGGGVINLANFSMDSCTFVSNSAVAGAGVYNAQDALATIVGSTFSRNVASDTGGAVANFDGAAAGFEECLLTGNIAANGAAIFNYTGIEDPGAGESAGQRSLVTVSGSTFTGNTASGGGGAAANYNSDFAMEDCLLADNAAVNGAAFLNISGTASLASSTASGNTATLGGAIVNGAGLFGLFEDSIVGNTAATGGAIYSEGGAVIIQNSLAQGNAAAVGGAITGLYSGVVVVGSTFAQNYGESQGGAVLFAGDTASVFAATSCMFLENVSMFGAALFLDYASAELSGVFVLNNVATVSGAGVYNIGGLGIDDSFFAGNYSNYGGVVYNAAGMTIAGSTFSQNIAALQGGVIYGYTNSVFSVSGSEFSENTAGQFGGAFYVSDTAAGTASSSVFSDNVSYYGGAVINYGGFVVDACVFRANTVAADGGAIVSVGSLSLSGSTFGANIAPGAAGALYVAGESPADVDGCVFDANDAAYGGAAMIEVGSVSISDSMFTANAATVSGGAVYSSATASIVGSTMGGNNAAYGGAFINVGTGSSMIKDTLMSANTASEAGGAIGNSCMLELENGTFFGNIAGVGGAVNNEEGASMSDSGSVFDSNSASFAGAVYNKGSFDAVGSVFTANYSTNSGAAVYNDSVFTGSGLSFRRNVSAQGALFNVGTVTISGSTFSGNNANYGGAIFNTGEGVVVLDDVLFDANEAILGGAIYNERSMSIGNATFSNNFGFVGGAIANYGTIIITGRISFMDKSDVFLNNNLVYVDASKFDTSAGYALVVDGVEPGWRSGYCFYATGGFGFSEVGADGYLVTRRENISLSDAWEGRSFGEVVATGSTYGINAFSTGDAAAGAVALGGAIDNVSGKAVFTNVMSNFDLNSDAYITGAGFYVNAVNVTGNIYCNNGTASTAPLNNEIDVVDSSAKRIYLGEKAVDVIQTGNTGNLVARIDNSVFSNGIFGAGNVKNSTILENATVGVSASATNLVIGGFYTKGTTDSASSVTHVGDVVIELDDVRVTNFVCGGSLLSSFSTEVTNGAISIGVGQGVYDTIAGGSLFQSKSTDLMSSTINGDISISVSGCASIDSLCGGSVALYVGPTRKEVINGDISILLDVSELASVEDSIYAGGACFCTVNGDASLTVKGGGTEDFLTTKYIVGASSYAAGDSKYVSGKTSLSFTNFVGLVSGRITFFDSLAVDATSSVNFSDYRSDFMSLDWNIASDSADRVSVILSGNTHSAGKVHNIDFGNSVLDFSCELEAGEEWTVFKVLDDDSTLQTLYNFSDATDIIMNGESIDWDDSNLCGESDNYRLEYRFGEDELGNSYGELIAKLA